MSFKDTSYLQLWPFCLAEWNHLCNFGKGHYEKQFCEIILNLDQCFRRCHLNIYFLSTALTAIFVLQSRTICAILVEDIMGYIHVKLF